MNCGKECIILMFLLFLGQTFAHTEVFVLVGSTAVLPCQLAPGYTSGQWLRLNPTTNVTEITYTDGRAVNSKLNHRISIDGSTNDNKYNLKIDNTSTADSGVYRCLTGNLEAIFDFKLIVSDSNDFYTGDSNPMTERPNLRGKNKPYPDFKIDVIIALVGAFCGILILISFVLVIYLCKKKQHLFNLEVSPLSGNEEFWGASADPHTENIALSLYSQAAYTHDNNHRNRDNRLRTERQTMGNEVYYLDNAINSGTIITSGENGIQSNAYESLTENWADYSHTYRECNQRNNPIFAVNENVPRIYGDSKKPTLQYENSSHLLTNVLQDSF